jgi:NADH dehydrogenase ubiquinone Fe-S protein 4
MAARIYQRAKNAMQSGRAGTDRWVLEFESARRRRPDPLTGWSGGAETQAQVRLTFPSLDAAQAYAMREGIDAHVVPAPPPPKLKLQSYADNFR